MTRLGSVSHVPTAAVAALLGLVALLGGPLVSPPSAQSSPVHSDDMPSLAELRQACSGTVIVVDTGMPATSSTRCVDDVAGTGLDILTAAGHSFSFVPGIPGMVCVIDHLPDPCNRAPASAYWSYWTASGDAWVYSPRGAGFRQAEEGVVEGWRFGDGSQQPQQHDLSAAQPTSAPAAEEPPSGLQPTTVGAGLVGLVLLGGLAARKRRRS